MKKKVNLSFIKAETILYKKVDEYEKKNIDFETMINRINDKKLMSFTKKKYLTIKNLKFLRNKVHLFIADSFDKSDFNSFSYKEYVWSKYALYSIITDKTICNDEQILINFKPSQEEMQFLISNPLIVEK